MALVLPNDKLCKDCRHLRLYQPDDPVFDPAKCLRPVVHLDLVYGHKEVLLWREAAKERIRLTPHDDACGKNAKYFEPILHERDQNDPTTT